MKKTKLYLIILIILLLTTPVSCTLVTDKEKEYKITYYLFDEIVELTPNTYISGKGEELPYDEQVEELTKGYVFLGWYDNPEYEGNYVRYIDPNQKGDLIFYGKTHEEAIYSNKVSQTVERGTSFDEIINDLEVYYNQGGSERTLSINEYQLTHQYNSNIIGEYEIVINYKELTTSFIVIVKEKTGPNYVPSNTETLWDVANRENAKFKPPLSSIGTQKILVIPVDFVDYPADQNMKKDIETAFFGSSSDTGWESLNSYYLKSSYNKLNITGTVLPVYNTNKRSTYYENSEFGDYEIIKSALEHYDSIYDFSEFDNNKDGLIDAIYLVYSREPDYENDNMWWAYSYEYYEEDYGKLSYDNVNPGFYLFASYEFLFETPESKKPLKYNLETFIHETGHLLGLDDYYDYDPSMGPSGGIGGGDMMDYNVGDHNPFSKSILGWVTPYLVTEDMTIELDSFGKTGECILIPHSFNDTYFDEYFIIDFYTPDGLNQLENGNNGLFSKRGVRIYHINAKTTGLKYTDSIWEIYESNNSTTKNKLIALIEADGNNNISQGEYGNYAENSDLFQAGDSYSNIRWYDGSIAGFVIYVDDIGLEGATITIDFK